MSDICKLIKTCGGALVIIDYAYCSAPAKRLPSQYTSTLQGIKNHQYHPVLQTLGQADLTAHVDFERLQFIAAQNSIANSQIQTQKDFLLSLGISQRLTVLAGKHPGIAKNLYNQYDYLLNKMGELFLVYTAIVSA